MQKMKTNKALDTVRERESSNLINKISEEKITRLDL